MEFEIERRSLLWAALALALLTAFLIGWQVSPYVRGHPRLLTPENRAIRRYLRQAGSWAATIRAENDDLARLIPDTGERGADEGSDELPTLGRPRSRPADIYTQAHVAQTTVDRLTVVQQEMDRANTPRSLAGLHRLALAAAYANLALANDVLDYTGAPLPERAAALPFRLEEAQAALRRLEDALAQQQQSMER